MRVRPQSYLFPSALLISLFFYSVAFSEKKNSDYREETDRDVKIYNENYKKRVAGSNGDIIAHSKKYKKKTNSNQNESNELSCYFVKNGDTLFSIAKRSGISVKKIRDLNKLNEKSMIYKGMKLRLSTSKEIKEITIDSSAKNASSPKPLFLWPLKKVKGCSRDGIDGVKSIGIIIKGNPNGEVIASENGVVKRVGYMRGYGKYIVVKHEKRYITVYSNLMEVDVKAGETVKKGVRIGNISDDMTLHFQIDRAGKPENPLKLLPERG